MVFEVEDDSNVTPNPKVFKSRSIRRRSYKLVNRPIVYPTEPRSTLERSFLSNLNKRTTDPSISQLPLFLSLCGHSSFNQVSFNFGIGNTGTESSIVRLGHHKIKNLPSVSRIGRKFPSSYFEVKNLTLLSCLYIYIYKNYHNVEYLGKFG